MLFATGDIHGYPYDREWPKDEEVKGVIIAGDFGIPFGLLSPNHGIEQIESELERAVYLNGLGYPIYALCGNHDDRDAYGAMESIYVGTYPMRRLAMYGEEFENIYIVDRPWYGTIDGLKLLLIPGAACHDLFYPPMDPSDPDSVEKTYELMYRGCFTRTKHRSWWEDEDVDEELVNGILTHVTEVDGIITHDAPTHIATVYNREYMGLIENPTKGEKVLEDVYNKVNFKWWIHGHFHHNWIDENINDRIIACTYYHFIKLTNDKLNLPNW